MVDATGSSGLGRELTALGCALAGVAMLAVTLFSEWKGVTGGIGGITNIPPARFPGFEISSPPQYLVLSLLVLLVLL